MKCDEKYASCCMKIRPCNSAFSVVIVILMLTTLVKFVAFGMRLGGVSLRCLKMRLVGCSKKRERRLVRSFKGTSSFTGG